MHHIPIQYFCGKVLINSPCDYIYDTETTLYYLQSRYYDPELGRFLNADAFASTGQGILGNNMFAYCSNNPVVCADTGGTIPSGIINPNAMARNGGSSLRPISDKERKEQELQKQARYLFNTNEEAVLNAEHHAFYKGILYLKVPGYSAFSFGMVFFGDKIDDKDLVRHEYGHTQQLTGVGVKDYMNYVVLPSVTCFWLTDFKVIPRNMYYNLPWEYIANRYGDVPGYYSADYDTAARAYWAVVRFIASWG